MYSRLQAPPDRSFFLFGPRGTGKTAWMRQHLPTAQVFDLLDARTYQRFAADPGRLGDALPATHDDWVVLDEIQRIPDLLNEVHRLIEGRNLRFAMTGSSTRKLRRGGANLLAGRARTLALHPLTAQELGDDFRLEKAVKTGLLPFACTTHDPELYLKDYVATYLREEVLQEGLVRNLATFSRFLEVASFSQGSPLNMAAVARECSVSPKLAESHFELLEDLLLAVRIPVFSRRAHRRLVAHRKFYYFDPGVYRALRPQGPLDVESEIDGPALETLLLSNLRAINDVFELGYQISYWRTSEGKEVDFVLYGPRGLLAFEVKRDARLRDEDLASLRTFAEDYPIAKTYLLHPGNERRHQSGIEILPFTTALRTLDTLLRVEDTTNPPEPHQDPAK